jgi:uncharacterized protein (DUF924 family)
MSHEYIDMEAVSSQAARQILDYWFYEYAAGDLARKQDHRWFIGGAEVDSTIGTRFGHRVELALAGGFKDWESEAESRLALIILLDQFTRHIFRGTARAFSGDSRAVQLARRGQAMGIFDELPLIQQIFALMPLEHSELLSDQAACVQGMERLVSLAPESERVRFQKFLEHANEHRRVIEQFGRFPHRNHVLGRVSTDNERLFLESAKTYGQQSPGT